MSLSTGRASTTIVQPVGSQSAVTVLAKAALGLRKVFFTEKEISEPRALYRILHDLQSNLTNAMRVLAGNPTISGNLVQGLVFAANTPLNISHGLGRAYQGFICARAYSVAWYGNEAALPSGATPDRMISLVTISAGTFDLLIF